MADEQQDPQPEDVEPEDVEDLKESAEAIGVDGVEEMDAEEVVDAVRHEQADSELSPSKWKADRDPDDDEAADDEAADHEAADDEA